MLGFTAALVGVTLLGMGLLGCGGGDADRAATETGGGGTTPEGGATGTGAGGLVEGAGTGGTGTGTAVGGTRTDAGTGGTPVDVGTFTGLTGLPKLIAVASGADCHLDAQGVVDCGDSIRWNDTPTLPLATFDTGDEQGCGLDAEGGVHCWGDEVSVPPDGPFTAIAVGEDVACAVRPSGAIQCWGDEQNRALTPPQGQFVDLGMDDEWGCAIDTSGDLHCWGNLAFGPDSEFYEGPFKQVAVGEGNVCVLTTNGEAACLDGAMGAREVPAGTYTFISVGSDHACGIRADGRVVCWEDGEMARLPPPEGNWEQISSYYRYSCLRDADGNIACWGPGKGDGAATLQCEAGSAELTGALDGAEWSATLEATAQYGFSGADPGYRFSYRIYDSEADKSGLLVFDGSTDFSSTSARDALTDGEVVSVDRVVLQAGGTEADAGTVHCSASGSTLELHIDEVLVSIANVQVMGTCAAGTAVSGSLSVAPGLQGTLDGVTLDTGVAQASTGYDSEDGSGLGTYNMDDAGLLRIAVGSGGVVTWAVYVSSPNGGLGGAVYCANAGSAEQEGSALVFELSDFVRLPECPLASSNDSLTGCVR